MPVRAEERGRCPHCGETQRFEAPMFLSPNETWMPIDESSLLVVPKPERASGRLDDRNGVHVYFAACTACRGISVAAEPERSPSYAADSEDIGASTRVVYPQVSKSSTPLAVVDDDPALARDVYEAHAVVGISPKASAALARRCVQHVVRTRAGIKERRLVDELKKVIPTLPPYLGDKIDHIRLVGNTAAHPQADADAGSIMDVTPDDAMYALMVLDLLLDHYYTRPRQARDIEERYGTER